VGVLWYYESPALPLSYAARKRHRRGIAPVSGSGGWIRTTDLRVMSPTS
jgi:hypothetical protein